MMSMPPCCLCSQIEGSSENDLIARMLPDAPYARRVMLENDSFAVIPSIAPLVHGHSLVCPKVHVRSFAALDPGLYADYLDIKAKLRTALGHLYDAEVHIFEHGSARTGTRVLCTVDHAHMHFVPLPRMTDGVIEDAAWSRCDLRSVQRLAGSDEYVFYETPRGACRLFVANGSPIESQYMSSRIAARLGLSNRVNWLAAVDAAAADRTWRGFVASYSQGAA